MNKPKIIFIDLDGTSLDVKYKNYKKDFSLENLAIIKECQQQKIEIVPSTGRPLSESTINLLKNAGLEKNCVLWNGAKVLIEGKEIYSKNLDFEIVEKILNIAKKQKITFFLNSDYRNYSFIHNPFSWMLCKLKKWKYNNYKKFKLTRNFTIYKVIFWTLRKKKLHKFFNQINNLFKDQISLVYSGKNSYLELTHKDCTKGNANTLYAKNKNVSLEDVWAIGDSMNDASNQGMVKELIGMQNSANSFKKCCTKISPFTYKNGGLAKTIKYFLNEENE